MRSRAEIRTFQTLSRICETVRELIPLSANVHNISPDQSIDFFGIRHKTSVKKFLEKADVLKSKRIYRLSKNQQKSLITDTLEYNRPIFWALLKIGIRPNKNTGAYFRLLKFLTKLQNENLMQKHHNDGSLKTFETSQEQIAKRSLDIGIGSCGELVGVIRTYLKIFAHESLIHYDYFRIAFNDHVLLVFIQMRESAIPRSILDGAIQYPSQVYSNFASFCEKLSSLGVTAFIVDPWINKVVSLAQYRELFEAAKKQGLDSFFEGEIHVLYDSKLSCLSNMERTFLSERHQVPEKREKYQERFRMIHEKVIAPITANTPSFT